MIIDVLVLLFRAVPYAFDSLVMTGDCGDSKILAHASNSHARSDIYLFTHTQLVLGLIPRIKLCKTVLF